MQINPSLLVCLSPSVAPSQVNELIFYRLVDQITLVKNVRMIAYEGQLKAFVQVEDQEAANAVISALNGRLMNIGKVKVFVSNKSFVNYDQTLSQLLEKYPSMEDPRVAFTKHTSLSTMVGLNAKSLLPMDSWTPDIDVALKVLSSHSDKETCAIKMHDFLDSSAASVRNLKRLTSINVSNAVIITHEDTEAMSRNRVLRVFRRFGRVANMEMDLSTNSWVVEYRSVKDIEKAVKAINENKLFGYTLTNSAVAPVNVEKASTLDKAIDFKKSEKRQQAFEEPKSTLRIEFNSLPFLLNTLVKLVSQKHLPNSLVSYSNPKNGRSYYNIQYDHMYQAAEALVNITTALRRYDDCKASFEYRTG